jgi:bacillolysin
MKNYTTLFSTTLLFLSLSLNTIWSQELHGKAAESRVPGSDKIHLNPANGAYKSIHLKEGIVVELSQTKAWLDKTLQTVENESWQSYRVESDAYGYTHERFKHLINGYEVENEMILVHVKNGKITSMNGDYTPFLHANQTQASLTAVEAIDHAKNTFEKGVSLWMTEKIEAPKLILLKVNKQLRLCYKVDVYALKPLMRKYVYVDAEDGKILLERERIHSIDEPGTAHTRYNGVRTITTDDTGTQYRLRESGRGNGINTYNLKMESTTL